MPTTKQWVQRVTVTLTMDCREDLPTALLEWMREALEEHAQQAFGAELHATVRHARAACTPEASCTRSPR